MLKHKHGPAISLVAALLLGFSLPLILGQGCPGLGNGGIQPVDPRPINDDSGFTIPGVGGNVAPTIRFTSPITDIAAEIGDVIEITWNDNDPDNNAAITLMLDPDIVFGNGNEIIIMPVVLEDDPVDSFTLDTSVYSLGPDTYRIIARITDGVNPEVIELATGRILLFGAGMLPANISPSIVLLQPMTNFGLSHNDSIDIEYCGRDPDDGNAVPDIVLMLDKDNDPTNDLDLIGPDAENNIFEVCFGGLPRDIGGAIVLACFKDNDCTAAANATTYTLTIDVGLIPPRESGDPYNIRATMWDHTNPPVHSYAPGNISITALGSGDIDLGQVGRTISGTKFMGFNSGDNAGSNGIGVGDIDGDGANDFVVVSRFGDSYERGNFGTAHVILGLANGQKFGNEIPLNSIGTFYRGTLLTMMETTSTEGIVSICRVEDVTGDGSSEILFGMPYVEQIYDHIDDDPCDCQTPQNKPPPCYGDGMPNPYSTDDPKTDHMGTHDSRETFGIGCSNDENFGKATPIDGGYAIMVGSQNDFTSGITRLSTFPIPIGVGQSQSGGGPYGARWRGAWYDWFDPTRTEYPNFLIPDNLFGQTVSSMPNMTDTSLNIPARYGPNLLISAPMGRDGQGLVTTHPGQNFTNMTGGNYSNSFPWYEACRGGCNCPNPCRTMWVPVFHAIVGAAIGDHLGYAAPAGDFNLDGSRDILCGAPGADRGGVVDGGIIYIIYGRMDFPGLMDLGAMDPPRMEIHGTNNLDQFGEVQTIIGDINQDGLPDIGFASQYADGPGGTDSGFIGIIFGGRKETGERTFTVNHVATAQLPGVKIYGSQSNGNAGAMLSNAGDFNGDGVDDMLICASGEIRVVEGQTRRGVAYLIFGGPHMNNKTFNLSQVGTADLPGMIFISPYEMGSAEEATIDSVAGLEDINGDGFADILIGVSKADYVNPLVPSQRRNDSGEAFLIYGSNTGSNTIY